MNRKIVCSFIAAALIVGSAMPITAQAAEVDVEESEAAAKGTILFDPSGWNDVTEIKDVLFYIWDETDGKFATNKGWTDQNTWGSRNKLSGTKRNDGLYESYEFELPEGHEVSLIVYNSKTSEQTLDCKLTKAVFGDTASLQTKKVANPYYTPGDTYGRYWYTLGFKKSGVKSAVPKQTVFSSSRVAMVDNAYSGWTELEKIELPKTLQGIGTNAFASCSKLKDVYFTGTQEQWKNIAIASGNTNLTSARIHFNSTLPEEGTSDPEPLSLCIFGDMDADKTITSADALTILRASAGMTTLTETQKSLGDIDKDGSMTSADALSVLRASVGLSSNSKIGQAVWIGL